MANAKLASLEPEHVIPVEGAAELQGEPAEGGEGEEANVPPEGGEAGAPVTETAE